VSGPATKCEISGVFLQIMRLTNRQTTAVFQHKNVAAEVLRDIDVRVLMSARGPRSAFWR